MRAYMVEVELDAPPVGDHLQLSSGHQSRLADLASGSELAPRPPAGKLPATPERSPEDPAPGARWLDAAGVVPVRATPTERPPLRKSNAPAIPRGKAFYQETPAGSFTLLKTQAPGFVVQSPAIPGTATATAIRDGANTFRYDPRTRQLLVDGKPWDGRTQPAGGTRIAQVGAGFELTGTDGARLLIRNRGQHVAPPTVAPSKGLLGRTADAVRSWLNL